MAGSLSTLSINKCLVPAAKYICDESEEDGFGCDDRSFQPQHSDTQNKAKKQNGNLPGNRSSVA